MSGSQLFISYSHRDAQWLERLHTHMAVLRAQNDVQAWNDRDIEAGDEWEKRIHAALDAAEIAVLLVSANFLDSKFIMDVELPKMLALRDAGRLRRILPLIVEPCNWKHVPALNSLEVRPKGRELSAGTDHQIKADLTEFVNEVSELLRKPARQVTGSSESGAMRTLVLDRRYATLEIRISHYEWMTYRVEMNFTWSGDKQFDFSHRYRACFDPGAFAACTSIESYAAALREALFPDAAALARIRLAKERADEQGNPLRIRLCIEPSARELHALKWELLTTQVAPRDPLALSGTVFARYALGYRTGAFAPSIRRDSQPKSAILLGVTADVPSETATDALKVLNAVEGCLRSAGIGCTVHEHWHSLPEFGERMRAAEGIDYLVLMVHRSGNAGADGTLQFAGAANYVASDRVREAIGAAMSGLERAPRLVVVLPAEAPGDAESGASLVWYQQLVTDIVEQGVLGAVTLQASFELDELKTFLQVLLVELDQHGQLDRAAREARSRIYAGNAAWAPVVTARNRSARLWYAPHFMENSRLHATWDLLIARIAEGRCTPIIGPGVDHRIARFRQELALRWADHYQYPLALHEYVNLPQVAQYVSATWGGPQMDQNYRDELRLYALKRYGHLLHPEQRQLPLGQMLSVITARVLEDDPSDPHVILADLPFASYVTANFNNFLADALRRAKRDVQEQVFSASPLPVDTRVASSAQPLVYHLFGRLDDDASLVLTEDDYFDFLIDFSRERERIPAAVRSALANSSLLFLGFNLNHWDFRVLFRSLLKEQSNQRRRKQLHVAVQVDPDDDQITDPDRAREYLEAYFENFAESDVSIYWGTSEDFLTELHGRWKERRGS
jgi:hypothetical protein